MYKKTIKYILILVLFILIGMIYFGRMNVMTDFPLNTQEVQKTTKLADEGNITAMTKLMVHYKIEGDLVRMKYWKSQVDIYYKNRTKEEGISGSD